MTLDGQERMARVIAFYLPQFHPIAENDRYWGKGFTEWTNLTKAQPLFAGHRQPKLPADLGFYDLRLPEVREAQATLAREAGVEAFCYWHYWMGGGKRLLERPLTEVLSSGKPNYPFCLAWANESWTGKWHGVEDDIIVEQRYPGASDYRAHFECVLPAFRDPRYLRVNRLPLFIVYHPARLPIPLQFVETWRRLAVENGLPGLYILGMEHAGWPFRDCGFDGRLEWTPHNLIGPYQRRERERWQSRLTFRAWRRLFGQDLPWGKPLSIRQPQICDYPQAVALYPQSTLPHHEYPTVISNWDNTPRCGRRGLILEGDTPDAYATWLEKAVARVRHRPLEERLVFVKSWNEWAEGNFLEPDMEFGHGYLDATRKIVTINPVS